MYVPQLEFAKSSEGYDALVVVTCQPTVDTFDNHEVYREALKVDKQACSSVTFLHCAKAPGSRLCVSPTGNVARDFDDVRRFGDAAAAGVERVMNAGATKPLVHFPSAPDFTKFPEYKEFVSVALLAIFQRLYVPLQGREHGVKCPIEKIGFNAGFDLKDGDKIAKYVSAVEAGRCLGRDLGGPDPERMAPPKFADYVKQAFEGVKNVTVSIKDDVDELVKDYPCLSAVARCSIPVKRHQPRVVRVIYTGEGEIEETLLFAGKGVTYDTGGADIKAGGHMTGMSRDKCGAANCAGLILTAALLGTPGIKLIGELGVVRNSAGADAYVADEVIMSHGGARVKVGHTDAEGRMVMADCLSHMREVALKEKNPHLFTCGTLTGHAVRAVGFYTISLDNGPAKKVSASRTLQEVGDVWGDPVEVSVLRTNDYDFVRPRNADFDVLQCNTAGSSNTPRGHHFPACFMIIASGLIKHGRDSDKPLKYSHLDVAASAVEGAEYKFGKCTGSPLVPMAAKYLLPRQK